MTVIFVHGYTASSATDWYPAISPELAVNGIPFAVPDLPGGKRPHAAEWVKVIHETIEHTRGSLMLVGHSLGTRAVLLYLEKHPISIDTVILIAPLANRRENATRRDEAYPDFFDHVIDLSVIKSRVKRFIVMHSRDDESVPYAQGEELATQLGATMLTYTDRGHFYKPENAPYVLEVIKKFFPVAKTNRNEL